MTRGIYLTVIQDVIDKVRPEFINGPGEEQLMHLQAIWKSKMMLAGVDFTVRHFDFPGEGYGSLNAGGSGCRTVHFDDSTGMIQEELRRFSWNDPGRPSRRAIYQQKSLDVYFPEDFFQRILRFVISPFLERVMAV
ncbi:hypothetical protein ACLB2K_028824 [Fragaria x ananassa]